MRKSRVRLSAAAATLALALVACGGSGNSSNTDGGSGDTATTAHQPGGASCSPSGTTLSISAKDIRFNKDCLAAPADQAFTVNFDDKEAVPHDVAIVKEHNSSDALFTGKTITGPRTISYKVPALPAGMYHFHCTVHPDQMQGTFIVK
jgi:plastocyanin